MLKNRFEIALFSNRVRQISAVVMLAVMASAAWAEPHLAQRYGLACAACHVNMTGGGMRNEAGVAYGSLLYGQASGEQFSPKLSDSVAIGANFRGGWTYTTFDEPEADGNGELLETPDDINAFEIDNGAVYLEFEVSPKLSFYLDQQVAPESGRTREAVAIFHDAGFENTYLKAGKFYLPFGLRLQDDDAFVREVTGFNFDNSDTGIEYGYNDGRWAASVAVSNGTQGAGETNRDKQVSLLASYIHNAYRIGVSASDNESLNNQQLRIHGLFAGATLGKWVFLTEVDWLENSDEVTEVEALVSYFSIDYLLAPSVNVRVSHEYHDPDDLIDEDERTRSSALVEKFLSPHAQLRVGARSYEGIHQNPFQNKIMVFSEVHLFF